MLEYEIEKTSQRKYAIIIGIAMIIMAVCAGFSYGFVQSSLVVKSDINATMNNISKSLALFHAEIFGWLLILLLDIIISWALYIFLKKINKDISLLAAIFRLFYSVILAVAISNLIFVSLMSSGSYSLESAKQLMLYINGFDKIWAFGLIIFGLHLLVTAYLVMKSKFIPKLLGILLIIASVSYLVINILKVFMPQYADITSTIESVLSFPMALGELSFGIWLIFKGGKNN